ncbi:SbcC/MukB-like Walker B domain-containing protein [Paenibacillus lignilyticus]|uniref:Nuclease SbcCD subunit C n=1 Tax=Paenibacillus lignilyticus TaxID=1172615 RepID=A0ABS5CE07_9BACL|nr:SbcC/MukB-like Walker B domain-containing protein [Paenibacillus lignilyticus]MBP3964176.1 hypothetical protein [Paenibacillus lignilyticus]
MHAQASAAHSERNAAVELHNQAQLRMETAQAEQRQAASELLGQLRQLKPVYASLTGLNHELSEWSRSLPQWVERVRREQREQQRLQLASQLAEGLTQGEPCPVCGSCVHPGNHGIAAEDQASAGDTVLAAWELVTQQAQQLQLRLSPLHTKASTALDRLTDTIDSVSNVSPSLDSGSDDSNSIDSDFSSTKMLDKAMPEAAAAAEVAERLTSDDVASAEALAAHQAAFKAIAEMIAMHENWLASAEKGFAGSRGRFTEATRISEQYANDYRTQAALSDRAQVQYEQCAKELKQEQALWLEQFGAALQPSQGDELLQELERRETAALELRSRLERSVSYIEDTTRTQQESANKSQAAQLEFATLSATLAGQQQQLGEKRSQLHSITNGVLAAGLITETEQELSRLRANLKSLTDRHETAQQALSEAAQQRSAAEEAEIAAGTRQKETSAAWQETLAASPFENSEEVTALQPMLVHQPRIKEDIAKYHEAQQQLSAQIELLRDQLQGRSQTEDEWLETVELLEHSRAMNESMLQASAKAERDMDELKAKQERWNGLEAKRLEMEQLCGRLKSLQTVFRGNAFVEYVAEEQLVQVCRAASERLSFLTKRRYALEVDSGGGFVIRDDANGGIRRPVSTLSGGETFLASLALALALSGQIQLRGKYPLQFFFLDEGFGTLDPELLDTVITALEKLHNDTLSVGVISHVPELRARLPRRLIVTPSEPSGRGSRVELETM